MSVQHHRCRLRRQPATSGQSQRQPINVPERLRHRARSPLRVRPWRRHEKELSSVRQSRNTRRRHPQRATSDNHPRFRSNRGRRRRSTERLVAERIFRTDDFKSVPEPDNTSMTTRTVSHRSRAFSSTRRIAVMTSPEGRGTFCIEFRAVRLVSIRQRTTPSTSNVTSILRQGRPTFVLLRRHDQSDARRLHVAQRMSCCDRIDAE